MDQEIVVIEREFKLLSRHTSLGSANGCPPEVRLERSAYLLLSRIEIDGPLSIGQLADAFGLDTSTVNRQTAALLRTGLAERIADPDGGMARKLRMTDEGLRRLHAHRAWATDGLGLVLADWTADEIAALAHALLRFNTTIEEKEGRPWPRPDDAATTTQAESGSGESGSGPS
ncbi:MarR family winged helix-turn-helix transcriptional regulator [Streptomyces sp. NPDC051569]|uniref:MarR family winged helix-turn-helix transcriptional regulator n=1 Tax=Streptomyces sp. NPDC051569 TaxID=3365661 RepID=UPI0037A86CB5